MRYFEIILESQEIKTDVEALRLSLENKFPGLDLWIHITSSGDLELSQIVVPKKARQEGIGTKVMQTLIDFADKHHLVMTLTPDNSYGGSVTRLNQFYRRFGFTPNKGRKRDYRYRNTMIRRPV